MESNRRLIDAIYDSYLNGQRKQMVSGIKEYESNTGDSFWEGLNDYIHDWSPVMKYRTLFEMVSIYTKLGGE